MEPGKAAPWIAAQEAELSRTLDTWLPPVVGAPTGEQLAGLARAAGGQRGLGEGGVMDKQTEAILRKWLWEWEEMRADYRRSVAVHEAAIAEVAWLVAQPTYPHVDASVKSLGAITHRLAEYRALLGAYGMLIDAAGSMLANEGGASDVDA